MAKWTRTASGPVPDGIDDFDRVKPQLKVRLCPPSALEGPADGDVLRQDPAPGIAAVLSYDMDGQACDVAPDHILPWATPEVALFAVGLANLRRVEGLAQSERSLPNGSQMLAVRGKTDFLTAQLLVLDRFLNRDLPYGVLACVPTDSLLLILPITDASALEGATELAKLAQLLYDGDDDGLSPHLYWWQKSTLKQIPVHDGAGGLEIAPPARFVSRVIEPLSP